MASVEQPPSVLVVEDNRADADLVVDGLELFSPEVDVHVVGDGDEALRFLRNGERGVGHRLPDLILLDLNLPRQGGLQTLSELRADRHLRRIPVIVLTTSKSPKEINDSYDSGAAAVLTKPMRLADQRAMVDAICRFWLQFVRLPDADL
jgi:CheY-like chemotaxis protein